MEFVWDFINVALVKLTRDSKPCRSGLCIKNSIVTDIKTNASARTQSTQRHQFNPVVAAQMHDVPTCDALLLEQAKLWFLLADEIRIGKGLIPGP